MSIEVLFLSMDLFGFSIAYQKEILQHVEL